MPRCMPTSASTGWYPLIVTALLAGLFVLVALQPGSDTASKPLVRRLVVVWIAQNMVLVASSLLRTADYIEAYALTRFRIAAMIWMALVAVGLMLICWRMLAGKSAYWLINANAMAALIVLAVVSVVDLAAVVAGWNVRHAKQVGGRGVVLDLGYAVGLADLRHRLADGHRANRLGLEQSLGLAAMVGRGASGSSRGARRSGGKRRLSARSGSPRQRRTGPPHGSLWRHPRERRSCHRRIHHSSPERP